MIQVQHVIAVEAPRQGLHEVTDAVAGWVAAPAVQTGLLTAFLRHTSASLLIQENVDPDVQRALEAFFLTMAPAAPAPTGHTAAGAGDLPHSAQRRAGKEGGRTRK